MAKYQGCNLDTMGEGQPHIMYRKLYHHLFEAIHERIQVSSLVVVWILLHHKSTKYK